MTILRNRIDGNLKAKDGTQIMGVVVGTVTVLSGANLQLHGNVTGTVILEKDSGARSVRLAAGRAAPRSISSV